MQSFKDTTGMSWDLRVTVLIAKTIKARTGVDIHNLFDKDTMVNLASDVGKTIDMLWAVIEKQATERGISYDDFFTDRCDSDVFEASIDRLLDAIVDYYPEKKRPHAAKMLRVLRLTGQQAIDLAISQIEKLEIEAFVRGSTSTS